MATPSEKPEEKKPDVPAGGTPTPPPPQKTDPPADPSGNAEKPEGTPPVITRIPICPEQGFDASQKITLAVPLTICPPCGPITSPPLCPGPDEAMANKPTIGCTFVPQCAAPQYMPATTVAFTHPPHCYTPVLTHPVPCGGVHTAICPTLYCAATPQQAVPAPVVTMVTCTQICPTFAGCSPAAANVPAAPAPVFTILNHCGFYPTHTPVCAATIVHTAPPVCYLPTVHCVLTHPPVCGGIHTQLGCPTLACTPTTIAQQPNPAAQMIPPTITGTGPEAMHTTLATVCTQVHICPPHLTAPPHCGGIYTNACAAPAPATAATVCTQIPMCVQAQAVVTAPPNCTAVCPAAVQNTAATLCTQVHVCPPLLTHPPHCTGIPTHTGGGPVYNTIPYTYLPHFCPPVTTAPAPQAFVTAPPHCTGIYTNGCAAPAAQTTLATVCTQVPACPPAPQPQTLYPVTVPPGCGYTINCGSPV